MPELYDFLLGSGVVLCEEGVAVFRGSIEGDREDGRGSVNGGGGRGSKIMELLAELGMVDILFIRCASVGLTVLAPSPDAWRPCGCWPGIIDIRLDPDPGVLDPGLLPLGELGNPVEALC